LKYVFLNQFVFEDIDTCCSENDILDVFNKIAYLLKDLRRKGCELIFDEELSLFVFNGKNIQHYFKLLDKDIRIVLTGKIQKSLPFCSNTFDEYELSENIVLGDCVVENTNISILENFLACAIHLDSFVITPKAICNDEHFLNNDINILCKDYKKNIKNFDLENKNNIVSYVESNIKSSVASWIDWKKLVLPIYSHIGVTDNCFAEIKVHSIESPIGKNIIYFIERINNFVNDKILTNLNYEECCSNTTVESKGRLRKFKQKLSVYNCDNGKEVASWHTRINNDFRLYFTCDKINNKICLVKFTKKIS
jgi:hypothetical protein